MELAPVRHGSRIEQSMTAPSALRATGLNLLRQS